MKIVGGHMYTGGGECVLVKWVLANPHLKSFLPRLPAPIKHLTIAPDNLYVAVSTLDNGINIFNCKIMSIFLVNISLLTFCAEIMRIFGLKLQYFLSFKYIEI